LKWSVTINHHYFNLLLSTFFYVFTTSFFTFFFNYFTFFFFSGWFTFNLIPDWLHSFNSNYTIFFFSCSSSVNRLFPERFTEIDWFNLFDALISNRLFGGIILSDAYFFNLLTDFWLVLGEKISEVYPEIHVWFIFKIYSIRLLDAGNNRIIFYLIRFITWSLCSRNFWESEIISFLLINFYLKYITPTKWPQDWFRLSHELFYKGNLLLDRK